MLSKPLLSPRAHWALSCIHGLIPMFCLLLAGCEKAHWQEDLDVDVSLTVSGRGTGNGQVSARDQVGGGSAGSVIDCQITDGVEVGSACNATFSHWMDEDSMRIITLTSTPASGSAFTDWGGACEGAGSEGACILEYGGETFFTFSIHARFDILPGGIELTTAISGYEDPSPSDFSVLIDSQHALSIAPGATATISGVTPGSRRVELTDVPIYCTVQDPNPRDVYVVSDATASTTFSVDCVEPGVIAVNTETRGDGLYPESYTVIVGSDLAEGVEPNGMVSFPGLPPGLHSVVLTGIPSQCSVFGENGRSVAVESGETVSTTFVVDCFPSGKGSLRVSTVTTGSDVDPDGYEVFVDLDGRFIGVDDEELFQSLEPGNHTVQLMGLAPNCGVNTGQFENPRTVAVTAEQVTTTEFAVVCSPWGAIRVGVETEGWDLDPDGYRVFLENTTRTSDLDINGEHTFDLLTPGNYTVALDTDGITRNCAVQGKNPTDPFPVGWGQTASVPFKVRCSGIVFQSFRDGFSELHVMNSDGTGVEKVLSSTHDDESPAWSPDRSKIVFASNRGDGDMEIYVLTLEDGTVARLTDNTWDDDDPIWSPNGDSILFSSRPQGGPENLYLMRADGQGTIRQVTDGAGDDDDQDWAPVDPLGGTAEWIVFSSDRDQDLDDELYRLNLADPQSTPYQLTYNTVKDDDAVFSPDGTKIAFSRRTNGDNRDIFVMYFNGTGLVQLTTHPGDDDDPSWSPDGTMIAFMSNRDGNDEIYVMNADGSGKTRLTYHASKDDEPGWRR